GNLLTILALRLQPKLRTTITAFVLNLAVVELLFCTIILPVSGAQYIWLCLHNESLLDDRFCVFFALVRFSLTQAELQTILAIALTRCLAICSIYLKQMMDRTRFKVLYLSFIWLYSVCSKIPIITERWAQYEFNKRTMECDISTSDGTYKRTRMLTEAIIPCSIIFVLYFLIFIKVKCSSLSLEKFNESSTKSSSTLQNISRKISGVSVRSQNRPTNNRDARVARTIFIVYIIMIICDTPVIIAHRFEHLEPKGDKFEFDLNLFLLAHILYWTQYIVNIFIYILVNQQYRKAYIIFISKIFPHFEQFKDSRFPWDPNPPSRALNHNVKIKVRAPSCHEISSNEYKPSNCIPDFHDRRKLQNSHSAPLIKHQHIVGDCEEGTIV
ncbi:unnamed protein product, partial [Meganyctiphanes norvegica]